MRRYKITIDFAIPIVVAGAFVALTNFIGDKWIDKMEEKSKEMVYSDSIIGAAATDDVPVVSSIEEMMEEDCFTFHTDGLSTSIHESTYYDGVVYDILELESGEWVLVDDYYPHVYFDHEEKEDDEWVWSSDIYAVYPVGKVVHKTIPDEIVDNFAEYGYFLTDTSFYVDMRGDFKFFSREDCEHDENIKEILDYRKQGKLEDAAREFSLLTNTSMEEAREAMNIWHEIYGEGILPKVKE